MNGQNSVCMYVCMKQPSNTKAVCRDPCLYKRQVSRFKDLYLQGNPDRIGGFVGFKDTLSQSRHDDMLCYLY